MIQRAFGRGVVGVLAALCVASVAVAQPPAPGQPAAAAAKPEIQPPKAESLAGLREVVARFFASYSTPEDQVATFALSKPFAAAGNLQPGFQVVPTFERLDDGRHKITIRVPPGTSLYGTGEVTGPLLRNGREIVLWNSDQPGYSPETRSLYQSHPWVLAVRPNGTAFGVLVDTTWRTIINLDGAITFTCEGPVPPVYITDRPSPQDVLITLGNITGRMPMPPRWALGYQQCRWSYFPEARVREVASEFRSRKIPATVLWFDIDYMDGFRTFTFSREHFPDPLRLNRELGEQGWKRVWMINPGVKDEEGYFVRDQLVSKGLYVRTPGGEPFRGDVWPGMCVFPDFTNPQTRSWWATLYKDFMAQGVDGVWNDMNEPAVFSTPTKLMPEEMRHAGGEYRALPSSPPQIVTPGDHARFHNVYGMLMAQATYEGILAANPGKRPFVLTRASFMGGHRYAATWTGDNSANWNDLEQSIPMVLSLGLSGQPFSGPDIGGFSGNGPRDEAERADMFARWMGVGTMLPFARGHTARGNINKEPWAFGPDTERASRLAIERRYRLLPYLYTVFYEAHTTGLPVARPLFFSDPTDPALRSEDDAFTLGADLMVVPSLMPDRSRRPVMPAGRWRSFDPLAGGSAEDTTHKALPELFVRPGRIIPMGPVVQFEGEKPLDELTLVINLDSQGKALGTVYEDAGDGFTYADGDFAISRYLASTDPDGTVRVRFEGQAGRFPRPEGRRLVVRLLTDKGEIVASGTEQTAIRLRPKP
jgi:alpha-glucosidase